MSKQNFDILEWNDGTIVINGTLNVFQAISRAMEEEFIEVKDLDILSISKSYCRYLPNTPDFWKDEWGDNGYYQLVKKKGRGAFPVWVIT